LLSMLNTLPVNSEFIVHRIIGGWRLRQKITEVGLLPGSRAKIVEHKPLIICVNSTIVALGYGIGNKIEVELL
jgi:Fe2+ transport system protein FeoA